MALQLDGAFWLFLWFMLNVGVTLFNKAVFKWWDFTFPVTLSLIHMLCSTAGSYVLLRVGKYPFQTLTFSEQVPVILFSLLFSANIVVGNSALRFVNVSLVQVVRSVIPGITMVLSMLILQKTYRSKFFWVIGLVVLGVAVASFGDLEFHLLGFLLTLLVCFLSSLKSVLANKFLVGKLKFHPFELLFRMGGLSALQMGLYVFLFELDGVREWWSELALQEQERLGQEGGLLDSQSERQSLDGTLLSMSLPSLFLAALAVNGCMAFLLNFANFQTTRKTSALTVTVAGNVKHILTIILSVVMFRNPISFLNGLGTFITLVGAALYSFMDFSEKERKKTMV